MTSERPSGMISITVVPLDSTDPGPTFATPEIRPATGARIVATLANEMRRRNVQFGLISICAQGGMGSALVLEGT